MSERPSDPWDDDELLARVLAHWTDFEPGTAWAYSNTGYLLVRRIVDAAAAGGFAGALERELLRPLGLVDTSLALELGDLAGLVPSRSTTSAPVTTTCEVASTRPGSGTARSPRRWPTSAASGRHSQPASSATWRC